MQRATIFILAVLACLFTTQVSAAKLQASVDRSEVLLDESIRLSLRYDGGQVGAEPDFSVLEADFDILSRGQSSQLRLINGKRESWVQWDLTLLAKRAGALEIPSIAFQGAQSSPLSIRVNVADAFSAPGAATAAGRGREYFAEMLVDKERLHIQEQLLLTVRLYSSVSLSGLQGGALDVPGAKLVTLGDKRYEQIRQGVRFGVYEVRYALFPQQGGKLAIPAVTFIAERESSRSLFRAQRGSVVRLQTQAHEIEVLPRPAGFSADRWLPASQVSLEQQWNPDTREVRVGEPITRTLVLRGEGVQALQLPPLVLPELAGVKYYREPAKSEEKNTDHGVVSERRERIGMVASRPGPLVLPALTLRWWDTEADQVRELQLPETVLDVQPAASAERRPGAVSVDPAPGGEVDTSRASGPRQDPDLKGWLIWSNILWGVLCLGLGGMWWRNRRRFLREVPEVGPHAARADNEKLALAALEIACRRDDPALVREALLCWAGLHWPNEPRLTLEQIGRRLGQDALIARLQSLDRSLYGPQQDSGAQGAQAQNTLLAAVKAEAAGERKPAPTDGGLPELYG